MKASIKFREDQKPLFRTKVPLSILGLPFQSGVVAGESKELSLSVATFFESGPSIKISYRPNDTWNPFSLVVKTGTGPFGSPISSSMLMSAEFNLIGKGNPSFMLHFKPQFGDFSIKKSQSSSVFEKEIKALGNGSGSDDDGSVEVVDVPGVQGGGVGGGFYGRKITVLPPSAASAIAGALSGVEVAARTKLPVRSRAVMNFRWGLRFPADVRGANGGDSVGGINFRKIPFLVMNKIGIEHVDGGDLNVKSAEAKVVPELGNADVADVCLMLKRQLEVLQSENGMLRKAVDDLRQDISGGKLALPMCSSAAGDWSSSRYREMERNGTKNGNGGKMERRSGEKKAAEADVNEELKKALKGATGGGVNIGA